MSAANKNVIWFEDLSRGDVGLVGGKNSSLGEMVQQLGEEQGFEAAVLEFLRSAKDSGGQLLLDELFVADSAPAAGTGTDAEVRLNSDKAAFSTKLITRIAAYLTGRANALEWARQAVGRLCANAYLDAVREAQAKNPPKEPPSLKKYNWFAERTGGRPHAERQQLFDRLLLVLPYPDEALTSADQKILDDAWIETSGDLSVGLEGSLRRFVPDTDPADLPVVLPLPPQRQEEDTFEPLYDGVGLLVRSKRGADVGKWSHVNLVKLKRTDNTEFADRIMPSQPAFDDGERSLFFPYRGHHLAFETREDPDHDKDAPTPIYTPLPPHKNEAFPSPPPLAYGTAYEVVAYAISRNGVLPEAVAEGETVGARLKPKAQIGDLTGVQSKEFPYSRRTGIGRAVLKSEQGAAPQRFDNDSVLPLAFDYPRIGLASQQGGKSWIDLWRRDDGSGSIALPRTSPAEVELQLAEIARSKTGKFQAALVTSSFPEPDDITFIDLDLSEETTAIKLTIKFDSKEGITLNDQKVQGIDPEQPAWIRLIAKPDGASASLTFVDPAGGLTGSSGGDARDSKDFVLLRPDTSGWVDGFNTHATYKLLPPTMSPTDLDRWLANPNLLTAAAGKHEDRGKLDKAKETLRKLQMMLLGIVLDEGEEAASLLREFSGFLPDLAVHHLHAELVILDEIGKTGHGNAYIRHATILLPDLAKLIKEAGEVPLDEHGYLLGINQLKKFLSKLLDKRTIDVKVEAAEIDQEGKSDDSELKYDPGAKTLSVVVPAGKVAQLRLRVAVDESLYLGDKDDGDEHHDSPPVIDSRLRQFAVGSLSEQKSGTDQVVHYHLFDGPAMRIEVMDVPDKAVNETLFALTKGQLRIDSAANSRAYSLQWDPAGNPVWQWCGRAIVSSQRWRHLGRPQTHWFNPSASNAAALGQQAHKGKPTTSDRAPGPVVGIEEGRNGLREFEAEAFDGRDTDVQRQTVRLSPLGEVSVLHEGKWELPSATMFRHRVTLQNRYAPAMQQPTKKEHAVRQWPVVAAKTDAREFEPVTDWLRVVVLANRDRIRLTRPQLRALMPLPLSQEKGTCPPIMAMLAEPPFADGGLADRIAAGVATGIGYAMKATPAGQRLGVDDMRQQFGPDPQLGYLPLAKGLNGAISLDGAGPIGLTFDRKAGTSAAFPNSAWVLTPSALTTKDGQDFQEHFASVSLQRYLAPEWISAPPRDQGEEYEFSQTRWFEIGEDKVTLYCGDQDVLTVLKEKENDRWKATTAPQTILPEAPEDNTTPVTLTDFAIGTNRKCALLHQPLDDKRAAVSIFAVEPGRAPLLMAIIHWIAVAQPKTIKLVDGAGNTLENGRQTTASLVTDMEWARTGRDLDHVAASKAGDKGDAEPVAITELAVKDSEFVDHEDNILWLRPSLHDTKVPLHLQRFLAVLPTYQAGGPGRAMQVYDPKKPARPLFTPKLNSEMSKGIAQAHLLEIECPARPIGSASIPGIPQEYKQPVFDLRECGIEDKACLLAMIRPSGTRNELEGEVVITFSRDRAASSVKITGNEAEMIVLAIDRMSSAHQAWQVHRDGTVKPLGIQTPNMMNGVDISFGVVCDREWWGSVALLSVHELPKVDDPRGEAERIAALYKLVVDFEWMFGPLLGEKEGELEASLSHKALRSTLAAQARIISISGAIKVQ